MLSRRHFLHAMAAGALAVGGCREASNSSTLNLRFWNCFTGPDGRTMLKQVKAFNAAHPHIHVSMQRIEWTIYYNKLFVAGLDGRAPDVFVCHASAMARLAYGGFLSAVDELWSGDGSLDATDFDPRIMAAARQGGATWGVPLDVHPIGMYLNRSLFREAGLRDSSGNVLPPTDREGFVESLRRIRQLGERHPQGLWGFAFTWLRLSAYSILRQWGGDIFADDGRTVILDSDENAAALTFMADLINKEGLIARPQEGAGFIGFRQGRVGMIFDGIFMLNELRRQSDLEYLAAPLPQLGPEPAAWADSHLLCIPSTVSGERRAAAAEFIRFLSEHALDWATAGQIPARNSQRSTPAFQAMTAQAAFARQLPYLAYLPQVPYLLECQDVFDNMAERALRASAPPRVCLREAAAEIQREVELYHSRRAGR